MNENKNKLEEALDRELPPQKQLDEYDNKSQVFRRKYYKGRGAPIGNIFLVLHVYVKGTKRKAEIGKLVRGDLGEHFENFLACEMRAHIQLKFNV